uniref:C-type lectin domain-containing protein n=1 Tax=Erpetoichthys calabaricus TaxID=27687 RepID=A0A8C4RTI9_ERPCA
MVGVSTAVGHLMLRLTDCVFMCKHDQLKTNNISERYSWINLYMTWNKAQQYCRVNYTDLVSIRNESENMEIMKKAQSNPFWIGLFNDPWKWSDGGQSKFKKWSNQEPNNWSLNEECVEIWPNGTWNDADCSLLVFPALQCQFVLYY